MIQRVCILGATGSVGASTLDVIALHPERFEVFALTAQQRAAELVDLCRRWRPRYAVLATQAQAREASAQLRADGLRTEVLHGPQALCDLAAHPEVDSVMAAIVGAAGLAPCLAAAHAGKRLMLANKEALVVGGSLFMQAVRQGGATLLPIDSEHSAIFQCLPDDRRQWPERIDHIVLTASGGPFRTRDVATLDRVTPEEAVAHPNWVMGRKISVDSATMMNKALEVIEARWLFDLPPDRIRVVLHPQSIIHSMVVCRDASVLAQASRLDFLSLSALSFEAVDGQRFPGLGLAYDALHATEVSAAVLNAANEIAVAAFLDRRIRFTDIHRINADTVAAVLPTRDEVSAIEGLLALDARARAWAAAAAERMSA